jgi:diaminopimelate decarboxylase
VGTPCHAYSASAIRERIDALQTALRGLDARVCYAVKANSNVAILQLMADAGLGADVVSGGELWRCLRAGVPAGRIVFSGVGKTADEIADALDAGIARFNLESSDELQLLQRIAAERNGSPRPRHASTRTSTPSPTRRFPPENRTTSSASISTKRVAGLPGAHN